MSTPARRKLWWGHCRKPIPLSALDINPTRIQSESRLLTRHLRTDRRVALGTRLDQLLPSEPGKRRRAKERLVVAIAATVLTDRVVAAGLGRSRSWVQECRRKCPIPLALILAELARHAGEDPR